MTIDVSPTEPVAQPLAFVQHDVIKYLNDRAVLAAAFVMLFCVDYAPHVVEGFANLIAVNNDLAQSRTLSGAEALGFAAIFIVLGDLRAGRVFRWWDIVVIAGIVAASCYPSDLCRAVALTCLGLYLIARGDKCILSLGQLCLGLAWIGFWGALVLSFVKQWLLPIEAQLAFVPLSILGSFSLDGTIISNGGGHAIDVLEPCSAFHNTITTAFIWLSLMKIQKLDFQLRSVWILAIGIAGVIFLNTVRIGIMALSETQYVFWHMGPGLWIVKVLMLGGILGLFLFGLGTTHTETRSAVRPC